MNDVAPPVSHPVALPIGPRTAAVLGLASVAGLVMLCWPLLLQAEPGQRVEPPFIFLALLPLVVVVVKYCGVRTTNSNTHVYVCM